MLIRKARRLLTMGPKEIFWRSKHGLATHGERLVYLLGLYNRSPSYWRRQLCRHARAMPAPSHLADWWQNHMLTREEPPFLLDFKTLEGSVNLYEELFSDQLEPLIEEANRVCRGEFSFLGIDFRADSTIDWQRDPNTGRNWPSQFYADLRIPFCDGTGSLDSAGDVKHVWELNRHEFLIHCAKAYYLTDESRFAKRVFELIREWIGANPYLQGVNWAGPLEVALRSMSWIWAYQFCRKWKGLSADDHLLFVQSLYQHGAYLSRHLEIYSSPNNHLIGEATALYLLGSFFPEFDKSAVWRERSWRILQEQTDKQFFEDGGSTEQAISYHHYCLGFFVLAILTRLRQELPVPSAMLNRLEAAFNFSMWMTTPDGTVPSIGDTDDARSLHFGNGKVNLGDFRNLLSLGATLFKRHDMKAVARTFSEDALWLLGQSGLQSFRKLRGTFPQETTSVFPASGYAILKNTWESEGHHTCLDCGQIGVDLLTEDIPIFTHGHADMLAVTLSTYGKPLLVDGGFFTYNGAPDWHRYTREVQAHNTIRLDGQSQAKFHSKNAWSCVSRPGPIIRKSNEHFELVEGTHSGFVGIKNCKSHRRCVVWNRQSCWLILDRLEGSGTHFLESYFHFSPGHVKLLPCKSGVSVDTDSGIHAVLQGVEIKGLQVDVCCGNAGPEGGWVATSYGRKKPAPVVRFHGRVQLPYTSALLLTSSPEKFSRPIVEQADMFDGDGRLVAGAENLRVQTYEGKELLSILWQIEDNKPFTVRRADFLPHEHNSHQPSLTVFSS